MRLNVSGTSEPFIDHNVTLTDVRSAAAGQQVSIAEGLGNISDAFGSASITGACTSGFTSDIAICGDT